MTLDLQGGGTASSAELGSDAAASDPSLEKGQACKSSCKDSRALASPTPTCSGQQEGLHLVPLYTQASFLALVGGAGLHLGAVLGPALHQL